MSSAVLAIDFGTTSSSATLIDQSRARHPKDPVSDRVSWPSAGFYAGGVPQVGAAAVEQSRLRPDAFRDELKTDLGTTEDLQLGLPISSAHLIAALLTQIRQAAEVLHGGRIGHAVLTVPASYRPEDGRTRAIREIARLAGLTGVEVVPEPVAAAFAPVAGEPLAPGSTVLVYDFGGGTFDAALVRLRAGSEPDAVLGAAALNDCGGRDVDAAVNAALRVAGGPALTAVLDNAADPALLRHQIDFARLVRELKHRASREDSPRAYFDPSGTTIGLDRSRLRELARPVVERTVRCCQDLIEKVTPEGEITAVVLVGGSTRLPGVREALTRTLRLPLREVEDVETAVCHGAAIWALGGPVLQAVAHPPTPQRHPLSWVLPPGPGTLLTWSVRPGESFRAGQVLARVRPADGTYVDLVSRRAGIIRSQHAHPGDVVHSGDWLVTVSEATTPPS